MKLQKGREKFPIQRKLQKTSPLGYKSGQAIAIKVGNVYQVRAENDNDSKNLPKLFSFP